MHGILSIGLWGTLATRTGAYAAKLLLGDIGGRAVGIKGNKIIDVPLESAMDGTTFEPDYYELVGITGYIRK